MNDGSALSCILLGHSHLDNALGSLLEHFLIADDVSGRLLNDPFGILSSFSARLSMCYALPAWAVG
jgi:hypothetical protein